LTDITVTFSSSPHRDIPDDAKISSQIIIDDMILVQTILSERCPAGKSWELTFDCNMYVENGYIFAR
jgi:hypothetical protein